MTSRGSRVAGRAGRGAMDRAGQLGRLRAWGGRRIVALRTLLASGCVLYGEWLWPQQCLYDSLPDHLVVIDLWTPGAGFASAAQRDARATAAGLAVPPLLHGGILGDGEVLERLTARSAYRDGPAEGAVLRRDPRRPVRCRHPAPPVGSVRGLPGAGQSGLPGRRHRACPGGWPMRLPQHAARRRWPGRHARCPHAMAVPVTGLALSTRLVSRCPGRTARGRLVSPEEFDGAISG